MHLSLLPHSQADGAVSALGAASFTWHKEIPALSRYEIEIGVDSWEESKWINVVAKFKTPSTSSKQILYCTCVSRYVMKSGRKTIPPWLAIATSGYGKENWEQVKYRSLFLSVLISLKSLSTNVYCLLVFRLCCSFFLQAEELRASVLAKFKAAHELKHKGKKTLKRDPWLIGGGYRKFGIFLAYDPNRVEKLEGEDYVGDENEELGLGKYQDRKNWNLVSLNGAKSLFASQSGSIFLANETESSSISNPVTLLLFFFAESKSQFEERRKANLLALSQLAAYPNPNA